MRGDGRAAFFELSLISLGSLRVSVMVGRDGALDQRSLEIVFPLLYSFDLFDRKPENMKFIGSCCGSWLAWFEM